MLDHTRPKPGTPREYRFPSFAEKTLASGAKLVCATVDKLPIVSLMAVIPRGAAAEAATKEGVARITARTLAEGTKRRSATELAESLESLGTALGAGADWDSTVLKLTCLSEHLEQSLDLFCETLLEPIFPEREIDRLKAERIADILQTESEPRALADEKFEEFLYTDSSRYSVPAGGSKATVSSLTRDDMLEFYSGALQPRETTFIACGDATLPQIEKLLSFRLAGWSAAETTTVRRDNEVAATARRVRLVSKPEAPQSELRVGHLGLPRRDPDYFPVVVMNAVLGGLFGSRINLNLREAHGYTYGASSYFDWRRDAGPFVVSTAVQTEVTAKALKEIFNEIDRIRSEPILESELSLAIDYLDGVFPIRYETTSAIAVALANLTVQELPRDYYDTYRKNIRAVTAKDVLRVARQHLRPEHMQTVIVGDPTKIRDAVETLQIGAVVTSPE